MDTSQDCCCHCPHPCFEPLPNHSSTEDPPTLKGLVQYPVGSLFLFSGPWWVQDFVCDLQEYSLFPPVLWNLVSKYHWPSKSDSLWISSPLDRSQTSKHDMGLRTFITMGELIWYYCTPVCGLPTWQIQDLFLLWLDPSCHLIEASSLSLDVGYLFLVASSVLLSIIVWECVVISVLSQEMRIHPSTLLSWTNFHCLFFDWVACFSTITFYELFIYFRD